MKPFFILIGAGLVIYYLEGKKFLERYKVSFLDAAFKYPATLATAFTRLFFTIKIKVENPTEFKGTLNSAALQVSYSGADLGTVNIRNPVTMEPNGSQTVEIPVQVSTNTLAKSIPEIIKQLKSGSGLIFNVKGNLNFAAGTQTVNLSYPVKISA